MSFLKRLEQSRKDTEIIKVSFRLERQSKNTIMRLPRGKMTELKKSIKCKILEWKEVK